MEVKCKVCGASAEPTWRDGKYHCAYCDSIIELTQQDFSTQASKQDTSKVTGAGDVKIQATCPICRNTENNVLRDGHCYCAMCGMKFDFSQPVYTPPPASSSQGSSPLYSARRDELEKEKNNRIMWGIIFIFLFWPVSVYHFYKVYQITQELSKL